MITAEQFSNTDCPGCDGLPSLVTCICNKNMFLSSHPSLTYRTFAYITRNNLMSSSDPNLKPFYQIHTKILANDIIEFSLTVENMYMHFYDAQVIFIREDLFDINQRKSLMFSFVTFQQPNNIVSSSNTFQLDFRHDFPGSNIFVGLIGYTGFQYHFSVEPNSPVSTDLIGTLSDLSNSIQVFGLAFYGYTQHCPFYLTMDCQPCPSYCKTCHLQPIFHCVQCNRNFIPSSDNQSCSCPYSIVGQFCDNFPPGCTIAQIELTSNLPLCVRCDATKKLNLVANSCQCESGYQFDTNLVYDTSNVCIDICGDGVVLDLECDDGNTLPGDGCSQNCSLQPGFTLDFTTNPIRFRSEILLRYEVQKIIKHETQNSAQIMLVPANIQSLPFLLEKEQFQPTSVNIRLKIIISEMPYEEVMIYDLSLLEIDQHNKITVEFNFDFDIQNLQSQIALNYNNTRYKNETQSLKFQLKGDNYGLKITNHSETYKALGYPILVAIVLNVISLLVGFLTSKFIGLETILTLQIIYYSQLLIFNISNWPSGLVFLKNLKYASGYNGIIDYTSFDLYDSLSKKLNSLGIKKLIIENFNISFLLLTISFVCLLLFSLIRQYKQNLINEQLRDVQSKIDENYIQVVIKPNKTQLLRLNKANQVSFWIANQICLWLILPLLQALSGELLIPNHQFAFNEDHFQDNFLVKSRCFILLMSLSIIFIVALNNFKNVWLSLSSHNELMQRPQEIFYKNLLFCYLFLVGLSVFFFNSRNFGKVYISAILLVLHSIYIIALVKVKPYKQSLKVHTVTLFINNGIILVFFIFVNLLNYVEDLNEVFVLALGFFLTGGSGLSLLLTFVRFYYELRYGKQLQNKIMEEKEQKRLKEQQQLKLKLKSHENKLKQQAQIKKSDQQKIREKNIYLFENQCKQEKKIELLEWLDKRNWDQKAKDKEYFNKFDERPLYYLKTYDQEKYYKKLDQLNESHQKYKQKEKQKESNPQYQKTVARLKKEISIIKKNKNTN